MEKQDFFNNRITELSDLAYSRGIVTFSDFLSLDQLSAALSMKRQPYGIQMHQSGGIDDAERQMLAFVPDDCAIPLVFPIDCIRIDLNQGKQIGHRDILGALLGLGIERSVLGDILLQDEIAYVFVLHKMSDFICRELHQVGRSAVSAAVIPVNSIQITRRYEEKIGSVASERLDALISLAFSKSRSSMLGSIAGRKVFVNGSCIMQAGYHIPEQAVVSIRGLGKFRYCGIIHQTKKGRIMVRIEKFI